MNLEILILIICLLNTFVLLGENERMKEENKKLREKLERFEKSDLEIYENFIECEKRRKKIVEKIVKESKK